jgi:hypothetical protein
MAGRIPAALRTRLGDDGTFGLIELLETERKEVSEQVLATASDRFERRMAEEFAHFRKEIVQELANTRVDMLKWSFLFWIGQVAAVAGLISFMLRRP